MSQKHPLELKKVTTLVPFILFIYLFIYLRYFPSTQCYQCVQLFHFSYGLHEKKEKHTTTLISESYESGRHK